MHFFRFPVARCDGGSPLAILQSGEKGDGTQPGKAQGTCPTEPFGIFVEIPHISTVLCLVAAPGIHIHNQR